MLIHPDLLVAIGSQDTQMVVDEVMSSLECFGLTNAVPPADCSQMNIELSPGVLRFYPRLVRGDARVRLPSFSGMLLSHPSHNWQRALEGTDEVLIYRDANPWRLVGAAKQALERWRQMGPPGSTRIKPSSLNVRTMQRIGRLKGMGCLGPSNDPFHIADIRVDDWTAGWTSDDSLLFGDKPSTAKTAFQQAVLSAGATWCSDWQMIDVDPESVWIALADIGARPPSTPVCAG